MPVSTSRASAAHLGILAIQIGLGAGSGCGLGLRGIDASLVFGPCAPRRNRLGRPMLTPVFKRWPPMIPAGKIRCVTGFDISRLAAPAPSLTPSATAPDPGDPADALQPSDCDRRRHAGTCRAIALAGELIAAALPRLR